MIKVGDIVYRKKSGWSGVPMEVVQVRDLEWNGKVIPQACCKGAMGWIAVGTRPGDTEWFAVASLTHEANSM